jgi:hypothetical protein
MARERSREVPVVVCVPSADGDSVSGLEWDGLQEINEPYQQAQVREAVDIAIAWREANDR